VSSYTTPSRTRSIPDVILQIQKQVVAIILPCPQAVLAMEPIIFWAVIIRNVKVREKS